MKSKYEDIPVGILDFAVQMNKRLHENEHRGPWHLGIGKSTFEDGVQHCLHDSKLFPEATGQMYQKRAIVDLANYAFMRWLKLQDTSV